MVGIGAADVPDESVRRRIIESWVLARSQKGMSHRIKILRWRGRWEVKVPRQFAEKPAGVMIRYYARARCASAWMRDE